MPDEDKNFGVSLKILESNNVTWKRSISLLDPHGLDYVHCTYRRVTTSINFANIRLYIWVERGTDRVKCPV